MEVVYQMLALNGNTQESNTYVVTRYCQMLTLKRNFKFETVTEYLNCNVTERLFLNIF